MPAPVVSDDKSHPSLLTTLFWVGVAIAPVAALILLVADGNGPLRFAAVLAILAVVLIGLSIALRADGGPAGAEELREEIDQLRRELRGEIVATAQRGNHALDQAQRAHEAVGALRRRMDSAAAALVTADEAANAGRARVAAVEPADDPAAGRAHFPSRGEAWRADREDADEPRAPQPAPRVDRPAPVYGGDRPAPAGTYGGERAGVYGGERPAGGTYGGTYGGSAGVPAGDRPAAGAAGVYGGWPAEHDSQPAPRPLGVVRHTETVHVTTRHTVVDGGAPVGGGTRYGGAAGRWSPTEDRQRAAGETDDRSRPAHGKPDDRPWAGQDDRPWAGDGERDDRPRAGGDREWTRGEYDDRAWTGEDGGDDRYRRHDDRPWGASEERVPGDPREDHERPEHDWSGGQRDHRAPRHDRAGAEQPDERPWAGRVGEQRWDAPVEQPDRSDAPGDDVESGDYWSQLRTGDRWASVREDDRGREVRVGERRAEVHADGTGTEYRVADRWAAVRRDEPRRAQDRPVPGRGDEGWRGGWSEPECRPELPAGGVPVPEDWRPPRQREPQRQPEPQWVQEPERYGRRQEEHYGYPPRDDVPRAGGRAAPGDRWR
ncbi:hypothetical protein [Micromonospora sp. NPDC049497]|uniref:hypothetical protein n=1 Tax=Micromonospora sp. NPDC049497 TaxID=3364273 RepID=UPI0037B02ADC